MKTCLPLLVLFAALALPVPVPAQDATMPLWTGATAQTLTGGRIETGLLHPLRWGISPHAELSARPIMGLLGPNAQIKLAWAERGGWTVATRHGFSYPTPFLRAIAREGLGGIIPATDVIPSILAFSNEVLVTRPLALQHLLTGSLGIRMAFSMGEERMTTIDLPIIYHRMAAYYGRPVFQGGIALSGPLAHRFSYQADATILALASGEGRYALEQTSLLGWQLSRRFALNGGYRQVYGAYPFGTQWHVLPVADIRWFIR